MFGESVSNWGMGIKVGEVTRSGEPLGLRAVHRSYPVSGAPISAY